MQHTIAAVFNNQIEAQQACEALVSAGFSRDEVQLSQNDDTHATRQALIDEGNERNPSVIRSFFTELFGSNRSSDAKLYSDAVRHGNCVLTMNVPDDDLVDQATNVLDRYHPLNIEEHASIWKSGGWSTAASMRQSAQNADNNARPQQSIHPAPFESSAGTTQDMDALSRQSNAAAQSDASIQKPSQGNDPNIQRSGVRVFPRDDAQQQPVQQSLDLRDQGTTSASQYQSSTADTLRTAQDDLAGTQSTPDLFGAEAQADQERDDAYYKGHWASNYADTGGKYEDYAPAYKHGSLLAGSDQYRGRQWSDAEPEVRRDWEAKNTGSTWEKIKAAVRHGWESMTNRVQ